MKKILFICVIIFNILFMLLFSCEAKEKKKIGTKCLFGILYYDWDGKPMRVNIPVVKEGSLIKCE